MLNWKNLDTLASYQELEKTDRVNLVEVMSGENGADRVKNYSIPMVEGLTYNYAAKAVDNQVLEVLAKLAEEAQLVEKFESLYNGAVINTGEKRLVLHQLTRGQLGNKVEADGVDKREFYVTQQKRIAEFANKVHAGEITNAAGEKFTTVVQIGIGGSDLGPRAMYLALENWAKKNNTFKMEAKFISNVDPDDAAAVLNSIDVAHSLFVLVSKSGTLTYQLMGELSDIGFTACLGAGGDPIVGTTLVEALQAFEADENTKAVMMIGEIGGNAEQDAAQWASEHMTKPVVAYIAGFTAPEGKQMGHAGAIVSGGKGTAQDKKEALEAVGIKVGRTPAQAADFMRKAIAAIQ